MKRTLICILLAWAFTVHAQEDVVSFTEGVITSDFVSEATMKQDLLQMLANFSQYMVNDFQECEYPNDKGEPCGCFKGENTMANDERGVRPNADLSMICAFLVKYGKPANVALPAGVTWEKMEDMARKSLVFAYSTHKANRLKVCKGNNYWGSVSNADHVWESSLWAMSVAYSAFFQWDKLSDTQKSYIYALLKAECNYELERGIPTGYAGDTKAEENGWEADVLAATLGLFPDDALAPKWFERLREFAINSYSHPSDQTNTTVIDAWYDTKTIADLYKGQNLYDDYSLQNHNLFHTSYQNVVQQELAMPNGNDWSLFLYDQITSYSTLACFLQDPHALMLENMAYKYIQARQKTTPDGSWLLRADVGARRMGVEAHRVMMTYLMHDILSTAKLTPTQWDKFNKTYSKAKLIPCQNIVRASTDDRFTCFSWSEGLKSYTGYFAANSPDKNKIVVPYRANNTGNILGWYEVQGKRTNATPVVKGNYLLEGDSYVMNGELNTNDGTLNHRFVLYSTPKNALIYLDYVTANAPATITAAKGGLLAISTDELMATSRTLYYKGATTTKQQTTDGSQMFTFKSPWVNIDNELGVIRTVDNGQLTVDSSMRSVRNKATANYQLSTVNCQLKIAFGDRTANNSIYTSKLYPLYSDTPRKVEAGEVVDARNLVYYSRINTKQTEKMASKLVSLKDKLPEGWNGVIVPDAGCTYLLISNFKGDTDCQLSTSDLPLKKWKPVFPDQTRITKNGSTLTIHVEQNHSIVFIRK